MTVLDILIAPHPTLKAKAKPVETIDDGLRQLLDDMLETMYDAPGSASPRTRSVNCSGCW